MTVTALPLMNPAEAAVLSMPQPTVETLQAEVLRLQAELAEKANTSVTPTLEEAVAFIATFAGKRGRRPLAFRSAQAVVDASMTAESKAAAKLAAKTAKADAKAARTAKSVQKKAQRLAKAAMAKAEKANVAAAKADKVVAAATKRATALNLKAAKLISKATELGEALIPAAV